MAAVDCARARVCARASGAQVKNKKGVGSIVRVQEKGNGASNEECHRCENWGHFTSRCALEDEFVDAFRRKRRPERTVLRLQQAWAREGRRHRDGKEARRSVRQSWQPREEARRSVAVLWYPDTVIDRCRSRFPPVQDDGESPGPTSMPPRSATTCSTAALRSRVDWPGRGQSSGTGC